MFYKTFLQLYIKIHIGKLRITLRILKPLIFLNPKLNIEITYYFYSSGNINPLVPTIATPNNTNKHP